MASPSQPMLRSGSTLTIAPEKAPAGDAAVSVIRPRKGGPGFKYTIPMSALAKVGQMNKDLDSRGRYDAVLATDGLFGGQPGPEGCVSHLTLVCQRARSTFSPTPRRTPDEGDR